MLRTRQALAVVVVTTALCADHVASAAVVLREPLAAIGRVSQVADQACELAGRFVSRLSRNLRQTVPAAATVQSRQARPATTTAVQLPDDAALNVPPQSFMPFQFRLPPPR